MGRHMRQTSYSRKSIIRCRSLEIEFAFTQFSEIDIRKSIFGNRYSESDLRESIFGNRFSPGELHGQAWLLKKIKGCF